jgi:hypothetical protein
MSDQLNRHNPELEAALAGVTDASTLRETLLSTLAAQGQIVRMRGDDFNNRAICQSETPNASLAASSYKYEREVRFAESTGKRTLVLRANSQADLDALERQVTGQ